MAEILKRAIGCDMSVDRVSDREDLVLLGFILGQLYVTRRNYRRHTFFSFASGPNKIEQQNLTPVQYDRNMFYKTMRVIEPGEELFVYYGDDYARYLGIEPFTMESVET